MNSPRIATNAVEFSQFAKSILAVFFDFHLEFVELIHGTSIAETYGIRISKIRANLGNYFV
jgi:hypothetical protein